MLGDSVNVERSAVLGQENSGHQMSGHIFGTDVITEIKSKLSETICGSQFPKVREIHLFKGDFLVLSMAPV